MAVSKLKKRKTTKAEEADATAPVETQERVTLSTRTVDPAAVAAASARALGGGTGIKTNFAKFDKDQTIIRILPGDPLFVAYRQNMTRLAGRFNTSVDLEDVYKNEALHQAALAAGKITSEDFEKFQLFGDPFTSVMVALKNGGVKLPKGQAFWPQTKAVFNIINRADGKLYFWEASKTAFESIMTLFGKLDEETDEFVPGQYPELFNADDGFDLVVTGNGKDGKARRYLSYLPTRKSTPVGELAEGDAPYDLLDKVVWRVQSWDDRARQMFASYGSVAKVVGITPETWGISAVVGAGVDPEGDIDKDPES